ncbi:hypothetical protein Tco_0314689, partial [Tanacetum coccineum]
MKAGFERRKAVKGRCNRKNEKRQAIYRGKRRNMERCALSETDVAQSQPHYESTSTRGAIPRTK